MGAVTAPLALVPMMMLTLIPTLMLTRKVMLKLMKEQMYERISKLERAAEEKNKGAYRAALEDEGYSADKEDAEEKVLVLPPAARFDDGDFCANIRKEILKTRRHFSCVNDT